MQRGEVIKCRQIWKGSQKYKDVPFVLILFPSVLILFPFARCHVCWYMQTCNVYIDSIIIFYFLFYRDSSITWQAIFNQAACGRCRGIAGVGRRTNQNKCRTKKYIHFVFLVVGDMHLRFELFERFFVILFQV